MAYAKFFLCISVVAMLIACGDNSSSADAIVIDTSFDVSESDMVVATKGDLPACTDKRDGAIAYVKDKKAAYICDNGSWVLDDDGKLSSSSSKTKSSSSSSKTKSSSSSGKAKSSSSSDKAKSSSSGKSSSSAKENSSSSSEFEINDKTISGVAQKGPFLAQSVVKIYELNPKTLAKTGKVFSGKVDSNGDGRFKVPNVELSSSYALLEVKGKFRNEVTGEVSSNDITLHALVNLEDRKEVNINLLTHLTYERILYLFGTGVDFAKAKKQAESEFSKAFYLGSEFENFEDMNIFGDGKESAALLAVSVLVLYYARTDLVGFLDTFVDDFRKDGTWDDETTKYKVGSKFEYGGSILERIRNNIVDWKMGPIPKFVMYASRIGCRLLGGYCHVIVTECNDEGAFIPEGNDSWNLCRDSILFGVSALFVDTYGWTAGTDGELRKGDSTEHFYKYDEVLKEWNHVSWNDRILGLNGCTVKREGEVGLSPKDDSYYVCTHTADFELGLVLYVWKKAQEIDFIRRDEKCESENIGRIVAGIDTVTNKYYCSTNGWVDFMAWSFSVPKEFRFNPDIDYGTMIDTRDGKKYRTVNIGEQVWMAENLNYAGDGIGHCYDDVPENCEVGGRLYKWDVAKNVCPEGWHLPSKEEFEILFSAVELVYDEYDKTQYSFADMFKATSGWKNVNSNWTQGLDKVGFSAVPAGGKHIETYRQPEYNLAGYLAFFLTSTEYDENSVYIMMLESDKASIVFGIDIDAPVEATKNSGYSVRCLKDAASSVVP